MSRVDLAKVSRLDKKTITNITKQLLENKQVEVVSKLITGSGRPKQLLSLRGDYCFSLGIDIGGTHMSAVLLNFVGQMVANVNIDTSRFDSYKQILENSAAVIDAVLRQAGMNMNQIKGIGVSFPGVIDKETRTAIVVENMPALKNKKIGRFFEDRYKKPVFIEDCSRTMALAELWANLNSDYRNFIVFDLGLGIGCGIVLNGKLFSGSNGKSGEIGHTIVDVEGPLCTCGRYGCIESLASGWALSNRIMDMMGEGKCEVLSKIVDPNSSEINTRDIVTAANLGDKDCKEQLVRAGEYVGIGVANAILLFNPTKVILGGRLVKDNSYLTESIIQTTKAQTITELWNDTEIIMSSVGDLASAIGAALLSLREYFE